MRLYFAGSFSGVPEDTLKEWGVKYKLYSFTNEPKSAIKWGPDGLLLDSGAYSAMTKGIKVSLSGLCKYIEDLKPEYSIQLDVIGDIEQSWVNYLKMSERVKVLPVIHSGATNFQIRRVLTSTDFICLGAVSTLQSQKDKLIGWIDHIFSFPEIRGKKIHCLGLMSEDILLRYPFYSADSSSALSVVRYPIDSDKHPILFMKQKTEHYTQLYRPAIEKQIKLQEKITLVWKRRGIEWD